MDSLMHVQNLVEVDSHETEFTEPVKFYTNLRVVGQIYDVFASYTLSHANECSFIFTLMENWKIFYIINQS